jgi:5-enolpyruvylshikimate-3-phosphate synthase
MQSDSNQGCGVDMQYEIASHVSLKGKTAVPGDERLTLAAIAAAMHSGCEIVLNNPSPSPAVDRLLTFFEQHGAESERNTETIKFCGARLTGDVTIDMRVPDAVLHTVVCQAVFSADSVRIESGAAGRSYAVDYIADMLKTLGVLAEHITADEDDLIISGAVFSPPDIVQISSAWAF